MDEKGNFNEGDALHFSVSYVVALRVDACGSERDYPTGPICVSSHSQSMRTRM